MCIHKQTHTVHVQCSVHVCIHCIGVGTMGTLINESVFPSSGSGQTCGSSGAREEGEGVPQLDEREGPVPLLL